MKADHEVQNVGRTPSLAAPHLASALNFAITNLEWPFSFLRVFAYRQQKCRSLGANVLNVPSINLKQAVVEENDRTHNA